jgi:hypothetical protein
MARKVESIQVDPSCSGLGIEMPNSNPNPTEIVPPSSKY